MRCIAYVDILKGNVTIVRRPPCRGLDGPHRLLLQVQELNNPFDGNEIHLQLAVGPAKGVRGHDVCLTLVLCRGEVPTFVFGHLHPDAATSTKAVKPGEMPE